MAEQKAAQKAEPKSKKPRNSVRLPLSAATVASIDAAVKQFGMLGLTRRKALALVTEEVVAKSADLDAVKLYRTVIERRLGLVE